MHIVVVTPLNFGQGEYQNMGDVAMLQVAVTRLSELWPNARVEVLTDSASDLRRFCPAAVPLSRPDCACWLSDDFFIGRFQRFLPKRAVIHLHAMKRSVGFRWPGVIGALTDLRLKLRDPKGLGKNLNPFNDAIKACDLMVVCGSGGFADSCREWNLFVLAAMAAAFRRGKSVVMFGQGIGPLSDAIVLSWAKHVLPRAHLIGLRGTRGDKELLEIVGVQPSKMIPTGDDALELANLVPVADQRDAIGINLRVAFYSGIQSEVIGRVGTVLQNLAERHHATLVPVPIAFHECANDRESIRQLLAGIDIDSDGGSTLDTPSKIMEQTARCRVVVTGAYHAAVFALAQGVPVVCLSNSSYYEAKFKGLEQLFGAGCTTITLNDPNLTEKLRDAIEDAWISADKLRLPLLSSAAEQIEKGRKAYESVKELFRSEPHAKRKEAPAHAARVL